MIIAVAFNATLSHVQAANTNLWEAEYPIDRKLAADLSAGFSPGEMLKAYAAGTKAWQADLKKQLPDIEHALKLDKDDCGRLAFASKAWFEYATKMLAFIDTAIEKREIGTPSAIRTVHAASEKFFVYKYRWIWQLHMTQGRYPFDSFVEVTSRKNEEDYYKTLYTKAMLRLAANKPGYADIRKRLVECDEAWRRFLSAEVALQQHIIKENPRSNLDWAIGAIYKMQSAHVEYYLNTYVFSDNK